MELSRIQEYLRQYQNPEGRLSILLVKKDRNRYEANRPDISLRVQQEVVDLLKRRVEAFISNDQLNQVQFNPSGHLRDEYSVCSYDYVGNFEEVVNLFNTYQQSQLDPENISFIAIRLRINDEYEDPEYVYFFKKHHKLRKIRNGFWMKRVNDTFDVIDDSALIPFDGDIDAIAFENEIAFFSHYMAERIFNLQAQFTRFAQYVLEEVRDGRRISNFDQFYDDCLQSGSIIRRLTKIQQNSRIIELFHEYFDNAPEVVDLFDLNIEFNDDLNQIVYEDKDQLKDITMLMKDAYYRTILADRKGRDDYN
ncbi:Kiwa anti-phage protein KwaB-like domain-containing protein [Salibacterium lacus]|uniref:Kiwa anti-phage protein KwaB-like domain-containing protein n=1 Tax=Salibacterium lacus TaxID=1898109 RepID=A0ABW5T1V0_9BACI